MKKILTLFLIIISTLATVACSTSRTVVVDRPPHRVEYVEYRPAPAIIIEQKPRRPHASATWHQGHWERQDRHWVWIEGRWSRDELH